MTDAVVPAADRQRHRDFLNAYYGRVHRVYDLSRKYYLFGRDGVLDDLLSQEWNSLVEVGPGTGRNLRLLHARRPDATYGGLEASDEMLAHAQRRCPFATLVQGFAEEADYPAILGRPPDRILFAYCLSMVQDQAAALERARAGVAPGGTVTVVDFADMASMTLVAGPMRAFLGKFHVATPDVELLLSHEAELRWGPGRYWLVATMPGSGEATAHS